MQYFHYDGVKQLNRLNVNGVSMNPSPIYEMHVIISQIKRVEKAIKICIFFFFFFLRWRGFMLNVNIQTSLLLFVNINTCWYERIDHK